MFLVLHSAVKSKDYAQEGFLFLLFTFFVNKAGIVITGESAGQRNERTVTLFPWRHSNAQEMF